MSPLLMIALINAQGIHPKYTVFLTRAQSLQRPIEVFSDVE
jgi:hypothetical protein